MITYQDTIEIPTYMGVGALHTLQENLRGIGSCEISDDIRTFTFGAEAPNMWELRARLEEMREYLIQEAINYHPDYSRVQRPQIAMREQQLLELFVYAVENLGHRETGFPAVNQNEIPTVSEDGLTITFGSGRSKETYNVVATRI